MKKIITVFLAAALFLSCLTCLSFWANAEGTPCFHLVDNFNIEAQENGGLINSYLTVTESGELMRLQVHPTEGLYLVEYFDTSYRCLRWVQLKAELPFFGGFYATESNYYVLSGQRNPDESASVECYRITKYDLDWNRLDSVGLYDCNTISPFSGGSARMTHSGNTLLIRTCHIMYTAFDGKNHQANVTIEVDTSTMKITHSFTAIAFDGGYVSHSFNQFIKFDGDRVVAVDHGDAYPRSIVLTEFSATGGSIDWKHYQQTDLQPFVGETGINYTGASVGGFEISDSTYLVAYNSVPQDENMFTYDTRNIYIAAMDKDTGKVTNRQITAYAEGEASASTPHLVKLSEDAFLLLWSRNGDVYYTKLNRTGDAVSGIYCIEDAALSDCVPVLFDGKLIWYTWEFSVVTFYDIDANNLSKNNRMVYDRLEVVSYPSAPGGDCTMGCRVCGHTYSFATPESMGLYWNTDEEDPYYWPLWQTEFENHTQLRFLVSMQPKYLPNSDVSVSVTNLNNGQTLETGLEGVDVTFMYTSGDIVFHKPGRYQITVSCIYNPLITCTEVVEITCQHEFGAWSSTGKNLHAHTCTICDQTLTEAHKWNEGTVIEDPAGNMKRYTCTVCGETRTVLASLGDVDGSGEIDASDYLLLKRFCLGTFKLTEEQMAVADVNNDGEVTALDYMLVKRHVLGTYTI